MRKMITLNRDFNERLHSVYIEIWDWETYLVKIISKNRPNQDISTSLAIVTIVDRMYDEVIDHQMSFSRFCSRVKDMIVHLNEYDDINGKFVAHTIKLANKLLAMDKEYIKINRANLFGYNKIKTLYKIIDKLENHPNAYYFTPTFTYLNENLYDKDTLLRVINGLINQFKNMDMCQELVKELIELFGYIGGVYDESIVVIMDEVYKIE